MGGGTQAASWSIDATAAGKRQCLPGSELGNGPPGLTPPAAAAPGMKSE
jgi:hypothetical protein